MKILTYPSSLLKNDFSTIPILTYRNWCLLVEHQRSLILLNLAPFETLRCVYSLFRSIQTQQDSPSGTEKYRFAPVDLMTIGLVNFAHKKI